MKIGNITAWPVKMPLAEPYTIFYETIQATVNVFCRIETTAGIYGYGCAAPDLVVTGETAGSVLDSCSTVIAPMLKGSDPLRSGKIKAAFGKTTIGFGHGGYGAV
jgi:L-alanine-DL-glutamate epimerase-like enolase superfamily enzyme